MSALSFLTCLYSLARSFKATLGVTRSVLGFLEHSWNLARAGSTVLHYVWDFVTTKAPQQTQFFHLTVKNGVALKLPSNCISVRIALYSTVDALVSNSLLLLAFDQCTQARCIALPYHAYLLCLSPRDLLGRATRTLHW